MGPASAVINAASAEGTDSVVIPVPPMIIESPRVARPSTSDTPEVMLQGLKTALYTADANWLGTLIRSWPEPCPPQDDDDIIWNFARNFMTWRDGIVQQAERGRKETVGRLLYLFPHPQHSNTSQEAFWRVK